jgi:hypothetical protein
MRTAAQRIAAYAARMQSSLIDPVLSAMNAQAKANFAAYANEFVPRQQQLRDLLDATGLTANKYLVYEAFNHEVYSAWRRLSGKSLVEEAKVLVAKYKGMGAVEANLKAILQNVWGITIPATP